MHSSGPSRVAWRLVGVLLLGPFSGCSSTDIPLVQFPQGAPPPPAAAKNTTLPQGSNTSQGVPSH